MKDNDITPIGLELLKFRADKATTANGFAAYSSQIDRIAKDLEHALLVGSCFRKNPIFGVKKTVQPTATLHSQQLTRVKRPCLPPNTTDCSNNKRARVRRRCCVEWCRSPNTAESTFVKVPKAPKPLPNEASNNRKATFARKKFRRDDITE